MAKPGAVYGFGFRPSESPHHFAVLMPRGEAGGVGGGGGCDWSPGGERSSARPAVEKARLDLDRWRRIADAARDEFNRVLRAAGLRNAAWKADETLLAPYLGKELTLLFW